MGSCHPLITFSAINIPSLPLGMVDLESARSHCLKLPEVMEYDHFGKPAYGVRKKIFTTLCLDEKRC